jgi:hypothetical protein
MRQARARRAGPESRATATRLFEAEMTLTAITAQRVEEKKERRLVPGRKNLRWDVADVLPVQAFEERN